jgi:hypothetical protein
MGACSTSQSLDDRFAMAVSLKKHLETTKMFQTGKGNSFMCETHVTVNAV